jgi:hypothetical protein
LTELLTSNILSRFPNHFLGFTGTHETRFPAIFVSTIFSAARFDGVRARRQVIP